MSEGTSRSYFQFPLVLLAYGPDAKTRLETIIDYCIVEAGYAERRKLTKEQAVEVVGQLPPSALPTDYKPTIDGLKVVLGMRFLHVRGGMVARVISLYAEAQMFIEEMRMLHGPSPYVRVRADILWEVKGGLDAQASIGLSYRDFAVLCGVYSAIGDKPFAAPTRDRIRAGTMGYKSASLLFDKWGKVTADGEQLLALRADGARPPTLHEVRADLTSLHGQKFFARVVPSRRQTYYSHRMDTDELRTALLHWMTRRNSGPASERKKDHELRAKIKASNRPDGSKNHKPPLATTQPPLDNHSGTAEATTDTATDTATIIEAPSEKLPHRNGFIEAPIRAGEPEEANAHAFKAPEEMEVISFAETITTHPTACQHAAQWFLDRGQSEEWKHLDWKKGCANYVLDAVGREKRKEQRAKLAPDVPPMS